jgi:hypothetical protein
VERTNALRVTYAQCQLHLFAGLAGLGQQVVRGTGQAVENHLDVPDHFARGGLAVGLQFALGLPAGHASPQTSGSTPTTQGSRCASSSGQGVWRSGAC